MLIDFAFIIVMILAIFKGLTKGLIVGIFSLLAFVIGLAAALKLSAIVASWLKNNITESTKWLPVISFIIVFIGVILLINIVARIIKKAMQFAMLGWLDGVGGILFYMIIYIIIFSVFLFFAEKVDLVKPATVRDSRIYPYISSWGPKVINNLGNIIPVFKDMFAQLQDFFAGIAIKT